MIAGTGCDLVDIERMEKALARNGFRERVFTPEEIAYCSREGRDYPESYAARFVAKEAFLKALGTGLREGSLLEISVTRDGLGRPGLSVTGRFKEIVDEAGITAMHLTLSHEKKTAMAVVTLEKRD